MRRGLELLSIYLLLFAATSCELFAGTVGGASPPDDLTVTRSTTITSTTMVADLTVTGQAVLTIDFRSDRADTFVVAGDIVVRDSARLVVLGNAERLDDSLVIANEGNSHRSMRSENRGEIVLDGVVVRTQTGTAAENGSVYMSYDALDESRLTVRGAALDTRSSWLLGNFHDRSSLEALDTRFLPTEIYINDSASVEISGPHTQTGLWLALTSGHHSFTLPDVSRGPWSWSADSRIGSGVSWSLSVTNANPGLGVSLYPNASASITGHGVPETGEVKIGYFVSPAGETLDNLRPGLQNGEIGSGRLSLSNVNLGPIAWQIYSAVPSSALIRRSVVNEVGVVGGGSVTITDSTLQLAVLAAHGDGSRLTVEGSVVWNQSIEASGTGAIRLIDSTVYGSLFSTHSPQASIEISGGSFRDNPPSSPNLPMVDIATGIPRYNPFRAPGGPARRGVGTIHCVDVAGCLW